MKRNILLLFLFVTSFGAYAQDGGRSMAFYGVDYDTVHHKRDTISHVDSAHLAIMASVAAGFNTEMSGMIKQYRSDRIYTGYSVKPGTAFTFGFDFVSKEYKSNLFFSLGFEVGKFGCTGNTYQKPGIYWPSDTASYSIQEVTLDIPFRLYYRIVKTPKFRLSAGLGISFGTIVGQYGSFVLVNPVVDLGYAGIRFDLSIGRHTWLALEPFYTIQAFEITTHIETAGIKIEIL